jgi:hypothetical protein
VRVSAPRIAPRDVSHTYVIGRHNRESALLSKATVRLASARAGAGRPGRARGRPGRPGTTGIGQAFHRCSPRRYAGARNRRDADAIYCLTMSKTTPLTTPRTTATTTPPARLRNHSLFRSSAYAPAPVTVSVSIRKITTNSYS